MGRKQETGWNLYVDESGNFADAQDAVAVAGLLARDDVPALHTDALRHALEREVPGLPWPLHAAWSHQPAWVAACCHVAVSARGVALPTALTTALAEAIDLFEWREPARFRSIVSAALRGRKARYADVRDLSQLLRKERRVAAERLDSHAQRAETVMADLLERASLSLVDPAGPPIMSVTASEAELGDASGQPDRYLALLGVLCHRVSRIVGRRPGEHRVLLHVLERDVRDASFGRDVPLSAAHVQRAALANRDPAGRVRLLAQQVRAFDHTTSVPFVMADYLANLARRELQHVFPPLDDVEERLTSGSTVPVRSGAPSRSHLSASGVAHAALVASTAGPTPGRGLTWVAPLRRWACEQATEWMEVAPA